MYTVRHYGLPLLHTNDYVAALDAARAIGDGAELLTEEGLAIDSRPLTFRWKALAVLLALFAGAIIWAGLLLHEAWLLAYRVG
jgi:hypothetical protein